MSTAPDTPTDPPAVRLLSVRQAAEHLGVSVDYVYDRIKEGTLASVQLGDERSMRRIRLSVLEAFVAARETGATK